MDLRGLISFEAIRCAVKQDSYSHFYEYLMSKEEKA